MTIGKATPACWAWPDPDRALLREAGSDTDEQWALMRDWHEGRCAICGKTPRRLVEDHCHDSGLTRGFLCDQCNIREGYRFRSEYSMYRECDPAVILGFRIPYIDPVTRLPAEPKPVLTPEERERRFEAARVALEKAFAADPAA